MIKAIFFLVLASLLLQMIEMILKWSTRKRSERQ